MPSIPKLPPALVFVLATIAGILTTVAPSIPSPWREVAGAVVAVLGWLGVPATARAVRRHGEASAHAALTRYRVER